MTDVWETQDLVMSQGLCKSVNTPPKKESRVLVDATEKASVP